MKYLIDETTQEEREQIVQKALSISLSGANKPSDELLELTEEYIKGRIELGEIKKIILEKYNKEES